MKWHQQACWCRYCGRQKVFGRTPLLSFLGTGAKDNGEARLQPKQRTAGIKCSRESSERTAGQSERDKTFEQARLDELGGLRVRVSVGRWSQ